MSATIKFVLFFVVPIIQDVLLALLFVRGMVLRKKRKDNQYDHLVSVSSVLLWVGAVCGGVLSIPVTLFGPDDTPDGVWYMFEVSVLGCIALILVYCNETVTYDDTTFTASNLFGIKHTYDYGQITGISRSGDDTFLWCGRRKIHLDTMSFGYGELLAYADKEYFKRYRKHIPVHKRRRIL